MQARCDTLLDDDDVLSASGHSPGIPLPANEVPTRPLDVPRARWVRPARALAIGERVPPSYRVTGLLGEGAMGRVYAAWDESLERPAALKAMRSRHLGDTRWRDQFGAEARALASVRHPNVVQIHGTGAVRGIPFFVMEYVHGETLEARLAREWPTRDESLEILASLCRGAQAIHDAGIVHGDLKPSNVLVGTDGRVAITDFGLAHRLDQPPPPWAIGTIFAGTPAYLAPERVDGPPVTGDLLARADVFALGVIASELLTGRRSTAGVGVATAGISGRTLAMAAARAKLAAPLDELLTLATAPDPASRPESPLRLLELLRDATRQPPRPPTVLVVDDDEDHAELVAEMLVNEVGARVLRASHGAEAVAMLRGVEVELVVADLHMPVMDGETMVRSLHDERGAVVPPIVAMSGQPDGAAWRRLHALGVAGFLPKPFDVGMLRAKICRLLDRRAPSAEIPERSAGTVAAGPPGPPPTSWR